MEAARAEALPVGSGWQYEPKWDGFRCLLFRSGDDVVLQSKAGQPLTRYFPELVESARALRPRNFVLDGEIIVPVNGQPSFDDLLMRIHPAASRIARLSKETPAAFVAFDILYTEAELLIDCPLGDRRTRLERFFEVLPPGSLFQLSPATTDPVRAEQWFRDLAAIGFDGVMAKRLEERYHSGDREAMVKVKHLKTADCVVGGFRYLETSRSAHSGAQPRQVGSLLLGLYEDDLLHHVGFAASFTAPARKQLAEIMLPLAGGGGFTGRAPGGPSRWATKRSTEWEPVDPSLVCEVRYDYFSQNRFRHGTKFLRWRPEKDPHSCTFDQV
jgi:ATP-dependent DNA ligase